MREAEITDTFFSREKNMDTESRPPERPKKLMPPGKLQFGIIIPIELHRRVKHTAADEDLKISDIYAEGARMYIDRRNPASKSNQEASVSPVVKTMRDAMDRLIESGNEREINMLRMVLQPYLSAAKDQ